MASPATASTNGAKRKKTIKLVRKGGSPKVAAKSSGDTPKQAGPRRYQGVTSGLSVSEFQNKTLADNRKQKLTDDQLAKLWRTEFPQAVKFTADTVRGVRSLYNRGKHRNDKPEVLSHGYDEQGTEIPLRGEKSAAKAAGKTAKAGKKSKTRES